MISKSMGIKPPGYNEYDHCKALVEHDGKCVKTKDDERCPDGCLLRECFIVREGYIEPDCCDEKILFPKVVQHLKILKLRKLKELTTL